LQHLLTQAVKPVHLVSLQLLLAGLALRIFLDAHTGADHACAAE
jgi:hypothetical protein